MTPTSVGVGSTTTAGRNAGIGTENGFLIYNTDTQQLEVFNDGLWVGGLTTPYSVTSPTVTANTSSRPGYAVFTFTSPGTLEVSGGPAAIAEYLVVAGGGGGGSTFHGTGGGAGALRFSDSFTLSPGTYTVTVGGGGAGGVEPQAYDAGGDGNNSVFGPITSSGGGGGGGAQGVNASPPNNPQGSGRDGGSGGGAHPVDSGVPASAVGGTGTGDSGGTNGSNSPANGWGNNGGGQQPAYGGGGGGAAQTGQPNGVGGNGLTYTINGTPTAYAGGGGGSKYSPSGPRPSGGTGGGGPGGYGYDGTNTGQYAGSNATANTGGGGGGSERYQPGPWPGSYGRAAGGNGGSGIVIIAYPTS